MLDKILNPTPTFYKWDRFFVGFTPGLFCPLLAFVFFYALQMNVVTAVQYVHALRNPDLLSKILSFGCIINLGVFFIFISRDYFNAARGVIGATILYVIPILIAKFAL